LSGGVDSSLLLYYMTKIFEKVNCFTIAGFVDHPDVVHAKIITDRLLAFHNILITEEKDDKEDFQGDSYVRRFYVWLGELKISSIVVGDGVDEFNGGYYDHLRFGEKAYFDYLERLVSEHLIPLEKNSNNIKVYLPYLDQELINMFNFLPLEERFDKESRKKVIYNLAIKNNLPVEIMERNKYGFCDANRKKEEI